jgi:exonuclease III
MLERNSTTLRGLGINTPTFIDWKAKKFKPPKPYIVIIDSHQEPKEANSTNARQRTRRETSAWHAMTLRLGLSDAWVLDSFHKLSKKTFTYDNGQQGPSSVLTRIDKFLVSQPVEERGGQIEISPSIRKISDHSPLIIKI